MSEIVAYRYRWKDALTWVHSTTEPARHPNLIVEPLCVAEKAKEGVGGLQYRPNDFDDYWGMIRDADGKLFAVVRRPCDEEELNAHRRAGTDPYEDLARRLIASYTHMRRAS